MTQDLKSKKCYSCASAPALDENEIKEFLVKTPGWQLDAGKPSKIIRNFKFADFAKALDFVNQVGKISEEENHHPAICFGWGKVRIEIYTHAVAGLTENDFILAAKINALPPAIL